MIGGVLAARFCATVRAVTLNAHKVMKIKAVAMKKIVACVFALLCLVVACNRDPNVAKQRYLENGNKYYEKAKYKEALLMYKNALKKDLKFGEEYYRAGLTELKLQRYMEAARDLQRAVELQPKNLDAHDQLANLFLQAYLGDRNKPKTVLDEIRSVTDK